MIGITQNKQKNFIFIVVPQQKLNIVEMKYSSE